MKKGKRILALAGVVFLAGLYLVTLVSAIFATPATKEFFRISLLATIIVPLIIYTGCFPKTNRMMKRKRKAFRKFYILKS